MRSILLQLPLLMLIASDAAAQGVGSQLDHAPTYLVLVPRKMRPDQELRISTTVFRLIYSSLTFRFSVREMNNKTGSEIAFAEEVFHRPSSRMIAMRIPDGIPHGQYEVHVQGSVKHLGGLLFHNRTEILLEPRHFSAFIQFSRPIYEMGGLLRFRVIPYEQDLMVQHRAFTMIEVVDSQGISVRRWLTPRSNAKGHIALSFRLPATSNFGEWKVRCTNENFLLEKTFLVDYRIISSMISVNVSIPRRLSQFSFGVYGILQANHTTNVPATGNATIKFEFRTRNQSTLLGTMWKEIAYFKGQSEFLITMSEIQEFLKLASRPANIEVRADAYVYDWEFLINQTSHAYTYIFKEIPEARFLGGTVRQFKPGFPFTALILVYQPNGLKPDFRYRSIKLDIFCNESSLVRSQSNIPIPDDSVVKFTFETSPFCLRYRLLAILQSEAATPAPPAQQYVYRHYSPQNIYMQVTTSTEMPTVDRYMLFNIKSNYYSPEIHYLILGSGRILLSDILVMPPGVTSRTFSIALSREMAPVARIVAYFMKQDGELVTDSMSFFVNLLGIKSVKVTLTEGSDLTGKTVTGWITGARPGAFALLSAMPYDLYLRYGQKVILEQNTILEELRSYELHAEQPMRHRWFNDSSDVPFAQYFPSHTLGPDANKTMNFSGLIMFTDANHTRVSYHHTCNETLNPNRAFPCYSPNNHDECYGHIHRCDGKIDCNTGVDELNCEIEREEDLPGYVPPKFRFELRHFSYDDYWLWQEIYVKPFPDGRMPILNAEVPKLDTAWAIGSVVIDGRDGLQVQDTPAIFSSRRQFYMVLEGPKSIRWGEQVGVRVALFNQWNYWTEVILEMKKDPFVEFVKVGAFGQVNSYAPETQTNIGVHTVVYLEAASSKMVYIPAIPRKVGKNVLTFCAYSFVGGECSSLSIDVSMNGVANSYHSPILLDLVSQSELKAQKFYVLPEEDFVEPEKRWRRFVPGSKTATFTVVGDIVGPSFSADMPVGDVGTIAWKPHGSAESVLFNINWNVQMLHYLRSTNQLKQANQPAILSDVNTQFARLSYYINPHTGGISNFPERFLTETSSFLTAFGVFTLAEAAFSEWETTIHFGSEIFGHLLKFLNSAQTVTGDPQLHGSFYDEIHYDMKYFHTYINDAKLPPGNTTILQRVSITAMVVIAVKNPNIPKSLSTISESIASKAIAFLQRNIDQLRADSLALAMTAYALTLDTTTNAKFDAVKLLLSTVRNDNYLYWSSRRVRPLIREPDSAGSFLIKPRVEWPNDALAVQATSFALLALYQTGSPATDPVLKNNITQIINFIVETKNSPRGWISTQDTVFALRALREVAQLDFNREIYQVRVTVTPSSNTNRVSSLTLSGANLSVPQTISFDNDNVWGEVSIMAEGSGRAVLQYNAQKSVENAFQVKNAADPLDPEGSLQTFELTCTPSFKGRNGSMLYMNSCTRWVWTERSPTSGMAIISYSLPSGYQVSNYGLRNFVQRSTVKNLRHAWIEGGSVNLFFTNISSTEETCVRLRFPRWFPVANTTIEQSCSVYEYFENDNGNFSIYSTRSLHSNDICRVCGSFQCPYCVWYNSSPTLQCSQLLLPLLGMILLLLPS